MARNKTLERRAYGEEPGLTSLDNQSERVGVYNWLRNFYSDDDAKKFVIDYLRASENYDVEFIAVVEKLNPSDLRIIGWNCRIVLNEKTTVNPDELMAPYLQQLEDMVDDFLETESDDDSETSNDGQTKPARNPAKFTTEKSNELISELEVEFDRFFINDYRWDFDVYSWLQSKEVKPIHAKRIIEFYKPLLQELEDSDSDEQLKEAYADLGKRRLNRYKEAVGLVLDSATRLRENGKRTRKPRKTKNKSVSKVVSSVKYQKEFPELELVSIVPETVIGATEFWTFNTKYRTLTRFIAKDGGFSWAGTTLQNFDVEKSETKRLKESKNVTPKPVLHEVLNCGKLRLNKIMSEQNTKPAKTTGRVGEDTILLRALK